LNANEVRPIRGRSRRISGTSSALSHARASRAATDWPSGGISSYSVARPTEVDSAQSLSIRYVENFPANLQLMTLAPWHCELLAKTEVECNVARQSERRTFNRLDRQRVAEAPYLHVRITSKEIRRVTDICWEGSDRLQRVIVS